LEKIAALLIAHFDDWGEVAAALRGLETG